jgi:Notch-like protein
MNHIEDVSVNCAQLNMDDHRVMSNHYKNDSVMDHRNMEMISSDWLQQQHSLSQSPLAPPSSIPTPPSSNPSHNSPLSMDGKLSPMKGKMLPTSPPHYLAMHQAQRNHRPQKSPHHYHIDNYPFDQQQQNHMQPYTIMYDNRHHQKVSTPMQIQHVPQYPTPPSQHSYLGTDATPPQGLNALPENILTPSPDSPGHWSSSSPHSAQSDWSEGISSPVPPIGQQPMKGRNHLSSDAVFI